MFKYVTTLFLLVCSSALELELTTNGVKKIIAEAISWVQKNDKSAALNFGPVRIVAIPTPMADEELRKKSKTEKRSSKRCILSGLHFTSTIASDFLLSFFKNLTQHFLFSLTNSKVQV